MNRILSIYSDADAIRELKEINVSSGGIESMYPKMNNICLKLENVRIAAANILKQEMLSLGGDAAVARGVVNGELPVSDVILMGNSVKLKRLADKLSYQQFFGLPDIRKDILRLIANHQGKAISKLKINDRIIDLSQTRIMGILNVTPDSFSDGNLYYDKSKAYDRAMEMVEQGATIIDIGGASTRPGALKISAKEEISRVIQIIQRVKKNSEVFISIDTTSSEVAMEAINAGADIINDISALRFDGQMIKILQDNPKIAVILMHMQGTPQTMQQNPHYNDVIREISDFLNERIQFCLAEWIDSSRILIDPGIGFGKTANDNLLILKRLREFHTLNAALVIGASRKSFIGSIYQSEADQRLEGSLAATAQSYYSGAHLVRVHDVKENARLLQVLSAVRGAE
jgi:dihydropteroate synthase